MSAFTVNPLAFQSMKLDTDQQKRQFLRSLGDLLNQIVQSLSQANYLASVLAGTFTLQASALGSTITDLGTVTTNQTVSCGGKELVFVRLTSAITQTVVLTLSALPQGGIILIDENVTANTLTFKLSATDTSANAYAITAVNTATGAFTDMVATGVAVTGRNFFFGMSGFLGTSASPQLPLFFA